MPAVGITFLPTRLTPGSQPLLHVTPWNPAGTGQSRIAGRRYYAYPFLTISHRLIPSAPLRKPGDGNDTM